jgi:hypothetical protein
VTFGHSNRLLQSRAGWPSPIVKIPNWSFGLNFFFRVQCGSNLASNFLTLGSLAKTRPIQSQQVQQLDQHFPVGSQLPSWPARLRFTKWVPLVEHDLWSRRTTMAPHSWPCLFCVFEQRVGTVQVLNNTQHGISAQVRSIAHKKTVVDLS